jgi:hypothetical protein
VLADRDGEADRHRPADLDHAVGIEAGVGPHRELPVGTGAPDPADRLAQEVPGAPAAVGVAASEPRHEHVASARGDREERVIAADLAVREPGRALLREPVRLADRGVEIDRERSSTRTRACRPGSREEMPADRVELADVAPAEAAQERAQGGGGLEGEAQDPAGSAGAQGVRIVDAVAARERGHDERQKLVADVRPAGGAAEVEEPIYQSLQAEMRGQGGRQQEARIGHEVHPVERGVEPVEAVGRSHPAGVLADGSVLPEQLHRPRSEGHLFACPGS